MYISVVITLMCRVRHIKRYRSIALKLLIISKNVSGKSFSVREGRHTEPPYFFIGGGAEATSIPTTQGHLSHAKYENSRKSFSFLFISYDTYDNTHR